MLRIYVHVCMYIMPVSVYTCMYKGTVINTFGYRALCATQAEEANMHGEQGKFASLTFVLEFQLGSTRTQTVKAAPKGTSLSASIWLWV